MIPALSILLSCQLAGEVLARGLGLPIPGPVLGMILLILALQLVPGLADRMRPVTQGFLSHLSLLFVPAGVGVVGHFESLGTQVWGILAAILGSTALAIGTAALVFVWVARATGNSGEEE